MTPRRLVLTAIVFGPAMAILVPIFAAAAGGRMTPCTLALTAIGLGVLMATIVGLFEE